MFRLHSSVKSSFCYAGYSLALCGVVFQGCGSEEKRATKDANEAFTLEWKVTPTIDSSCKLTVPALATFAEYAEEVTKAEKPFNSKKKSESLLKSKFDSATAKLTLESGKEICESTPAATEEGISCALKSLPPPQEASASEWLPTQNLLSTLTVKGKEPAAEKTLSRKLKLEISKFKSLTKLEPVSPPTLAANLSAGMQAGCSETGCLPGSRASVATGFYHSCAVSADGGASCWGFNSSGQLGNGTTTDSKYAVVVTSSANVSQISAGSSHTCALIFDGTVKCWGSNSSGQSASGSISSNNSSPVAVSGLTGVAAIGAGSSHTCALITDGTVKCWGSNTNRQILDTSQVNYATPTDVTGVTGAVAIAVGGSHTCALVTDGTVKCWGYNYYGQVGDGSADGGVTSANRQKPVTAVTGITGAKGLFAGDQHTCAVLTDGSMKCWGLNSSGQLGYFPATSSCPNSGSNSTICEPTPVVAANVADVVTGSAGLYNTCFLTVKGAVKCMGSHGSIYGTKPMQFIEKGAVAVESGYDHSCAVKEGGNVVCWGKNYYGMLGDGNSAEYPESNTNVSYDKVSESPVLKDENTVLVGQNKVCRAYSVSVVTETK